MSLFHIVEKWSYKILHLFATNLSDTFLLISFQASKSISIAILDISKKEYPQKILIKALVANVRISEKKITQMRTIFTTIFLIENAIFYTIFTVIQNFKYPLIDLTKNMIYFMLINNNFGAKYVLAIFKLREKQQNSCHSLTCRKFVL